MKPRTMKFRRWILVILSAAVLLVFIAQLMTIQIVEGETYKNMLSSSRISTQTVKAVRGEIVDRNGSPLAVNRMGYDIIFDKAFLPSDRQNAIILMLMEIFELNSQSWTDNLPLSAAPPFAFEPGLDLEATRLKNLLGTQSYATAEDVMYQLVKRYKLTSFSPEEQRKIAGVRYEMEQRGFALNVPYTFATDIDISLVIKIKERSYELLGVDVAERAIRRFENGILAPHIIGTTGPIYKEEYQDLKLLGYAMDDTIGKGGVEKAFEKHLRGQNGKREIFIGQTGDVLEAVESVPPTPGNTVVLTLDSNLQLLAQDALRCQIERLQQTALPGQGKEASSGAVVVLNAKTGEILVAATYPSYNLETYRQDYSKLVQETELTPLFNRAFLGEYAPGSTFKPAVALAGLEAGTIDEKSTISCGGTYTFYQDYRPTCLSVHGAITVKHALTVSCNIFFYETGRRTGMDAINSMARQLGLGEYTGLELPEKPGQLSTPETKMKSRGEQWFPGDVLQASIGQMMNKFTPLQLANYAATIGNRGKHMKVTLVHEIRDYSFKKVVQPFSPEISNQVDASPETFAAVIDGMIAASRPGGTASRYFGYYPITIASKTGTPQTADFPNSTFITFAPAEDPQYAIAVVIEKGWHGYTGAPVAKAMYNALFGIEQPSELPPQLLTLPSYTHYFPDALQEDATEPFPFAGTQEQTGEQVAESQ